MRIGDRCAFKLHDGSLRRGAVREIHAENRYTLVDSSGELHRRWCVIDGAV